MHLTYADLVKLGRPDLWPDDLPKDAGTSGGRTRRGSGSGVAPHSPLPRYSKTQAAYGERLRLLRDAGILEKVEEEKTKLRLAGRTTYTTDFTVWFESGRNELEIKGHMKEDAAVKLKVAAEMYQDRRFWLVYGKLHKRDYIWDVREVTAASGIGRRSVVLPWEVG